MRLADLVTARVAIWGFGREGRSVLAALRRLEPGMQVTILDDRPWTDAERAAAGPDLWVVCGPEAIARALGDQQLVVRSPGVSVYRREIAEARGRGVEFTTATNLWFAEPRSGRTVCITGSKGKSTTAALVAHLLGAASVEVALGGNIGRPLLDLLGGTPEVFVVELSSYQTSDLVGDADVAAVVSLYPDHLDWHGGEERYYRDKLNLLHAVDAHGVAVVDATSVRLMAAVAGRDRVRTFGDAAGIHPRGRDLWWGERCLARDVPGLPGTHNLLNLAAALTIVDCLGVDLEAGLAALASFQGLPHRLQLLGARDGLSFVDDSISTIPASAMAAVSCYADRPLSLILGGRDRGVDYSQLARFAVERQLHLVVTLPESGVRIAAELRAARGTHARPEVVEAGSMAEAVACARERTPHGGVVLLSPAAASGSAFRDYRERGRRFAEAAGVEPARDDEG